MRADQVSVTLPVSVFVFARTTATTSVDTRAAAGATDGTAATNASTRAGVDAAVGIARSWALFLSGHRTGRDIGQHPAEGRRRAGDERDRHPPAVASDAQRRRHARRGDGATYGVVAVTPGGRTGGDGGRVPRPMMGQQQLREGDDERDDDDHGGQRNGEFRCSHA